MDRIGDLLQSLLKYKGAIGLASLIVLGALWVLLQILRLSIFATVGAAGTLGLLTLIVRSVFWLAVTAVVVSAVAYVLPARLFIPVSKVEYAVAVGTGSQSASRFFPQASWSGRRCGGSPVIVTGTFPRAN